MAGRDRVFTFAGTTLVNKETLDSSQRIDAATTKLCSRPLSKQSKHRPTTETVKQLDPTHYG